MKEDPENKDLIEEEEDDQVWKSVALEHATLRRCYSIRVQAQ